MATIVENVRTRAIWGDKYARTLQYTGPASYDATNGDPIVPGDVFLGEIEGVLGQATALNAAGAAPRSVVFVRQALTDSGVVARWFVPNTGLEVAGATDLSGYSLQLTFIGKG